MKNIYLIIFGFFIWSTVCSQIINIPDANFKAKLLESDSGVPIAYGDGGSFKIDANNNGEIEVNEVLLVNTLNVRDSNISDLTGIEYFTNITELRCETNSLTALDVTMLPEIRTLGVYDNELIELNITGLSNLQNIYASRNLLSSIDLNGLVNLSRIDIDGNELLSIDFSATPNLHFVSCFDNQLTTLDLSSILELYQIDCSFNQLETLNLNNEFLEFNINFSNNENLQYICADDEQIMNIENKIIEYNYTNCFTNSLCSFVQGEDFFTLLGNVKYDEDGNGCDSNDFDYPELLFSLSDGTNSGTVFADIFGNYTYSVQAGAYTLTPSLDNLTYFSITPETANINFPEHSSDNIIDFCVTSNGVYPDLEIFMQEYDDEYDLFVSYKIIYKNKGTMTQSGSISMIYDNVLASLSSSQPTVSNEIANELIWDFSDLKPFESREIEIVMDLSAIEEDLNGAILVNYLASINSSLSDTTPSDNIFELNEPFFCCLLNIEEFVFSDYFSLYPNPSEQFVNIRMKKQIDVQSVSVFNLLGQEIKRMPFNNDDLIINVSDLESGHYFIKISTKKKEFFARFIRK